MKGRPVTNPPVICGLDDRWLTAWWEKFLQKDSLTAGCFGGGKSRIVLGGHVCLDARKHSMTTTSAR